MLGLHIHKSLVAANQPAHALIMAAESAPDGFRITRGYITGLLDRVSAVPTLETPAAVRTHDAEVERIFNAVTSEKRTWQSCGKRGVHLPQLEALGRLIVETFPQVLSYPRNKAHTSASIGREQAEHVS